MTVSRLLLFPSRAVGTPTAIVFYLLPAKENRAMLRYRYQTQRAGHIPEGFLKQKASCLFQMGETGAWAERKNGMYSAKMNSCPQPESLYRGDFCCSNTILQRAERRPGAPAGLRAAAWAAKTVRAG